MNPDPLKDDNKPTPQEVAPINPLLNHSPNIAEPQYQDTNSYLVQPQQPAIDNPPPYQSTAQNTITTPVKSKKRLFISIVVALIVVSLITAGGVFAFFTLRITPEERLFKALGNSLSTPTLLQEFKTTSDNGSVDLSVKSDFSNPAKTKTEARLSIKYDGLADQLDYNIISLPNKETYVQFAYKGLSENSRSLNSILANRWFTADFENSLIISEFNSGINTSSGEVVTGNFEPDLRKELLSKIKTENIYTINSSSTSTLNGKSVLVLDLSLNTDKIKELNDLWAKKLNAQITHPYEGYANKGKVTIDTETNRIIRVDTDESGNKVTVTYSQFGESFTITKPSSFLTKEEFVRLLEKSGYDQTMLPF